MGTNLVKGVHLGWIDCVMKTSLSNAYHGLMLNNICVQKSVCMDVISFQERWTETQMHVGVWGDGLGVKFVIICAVQHEIFVLCSMWIRHQSDWIWGQIGAFRIRKIYKMQIQMDSGKKIQLKRIRKPQLLLSQDELMAMKENKYNCLFDKSQKHPKKKT